MTALHPAPQPTSPASGEPTPPHLHVAPDRSTGRGAQHGPDRGPGPVPSTVRSQTVDVVRAACVLIVVMLHALMVGVQRSSDGGLSTQVALAGTEWFAPVSWLIQIMPLFFIVGGFASAQHWRGVKSRGGTAAEFVRSRVRRLALPAATMILVVGSALALAGGLGVDPALLAEARLRVAQPLWFLAVYIGVTAMVPIMMRMHGLRPTVTLLGLGGGIVIVDAVRLTAELPAVGYANLVFVWLLMQQLGFLLSDGRVEVWASRRVRMGLGAGTGARRSGGVPRGMLLSIVVLGLLVVVVTRGPYSVDMLVNLNPPTAALALLGLAQFFALSAVKPRLDRWWHAADDSEHSGAVSARGAMRVRAIARAGSAVSAGSMTLYLWHMPVVLAVAAAIWAVGLPLPAPHSEAWWLTRIPWLVALALVWGGAYAMRQAMTRAWQNVVRRALTSVAARWTLPSWGWSSRGKHSPRGASADQGVRTNRGASANQGTSANQAVLYVLAAVAGVVIVLFCLGEIIPSTLVTSALLTLSVWPVPRRGRAGGIIREDRSAPGDTGDEAR